MLGNKPKPRPKAKVKTFKLKKKTVQVVPKRRPPTLRQQKLAMEITANLSKKGKMLSKAEMLRNAGYSESQARRPSTVFDSPIVKAVIDPYVEGINRLRLAYLEILEDPSHVKKQKKARSRDLVQNMKDLTHDYQLLTGGDTEKNNDISVLASTIDGLIKGAKTTKK